MSRIWKHLLAVSLLIVPVLASGQKSIDEQERTAQDTVVYRVYGMDCPGCTRGLEKQVNKIPAVKTSDANWVKQRLEVVVMKDSVLKRENIEFRVKKANFTLAREESTEQHEE